MYKSYHVDKPLFDSAFDFKCLVEVFLIVRYIYVFSMWFEDIESWNILETFNLYVTSILSSNNFSSHFKAFDLLNWQVSSHCFFFHKWCSSFMWQSILCSNIPPHVSKAFQVLPWHRNWESQRRIGLQLTSVLMWMWIMLRWDEDEVFLTWQIWWSLELHNFTCFIFFLLCVYFFLWPLSSSFGIFQLHLLDSSFALICPSFSIIWFSFAPSSSPLHV